VAHNADMGTPNRTPQAPKPTPAPPRPEPDVDEAGDESFPASDPPGWGSSHASAVPAPRTRLQRLADGIRAKVRELRVVIHRP